MGRVGTAMGTAMGVDRAAAGGEAARRASAATSTGPPPLPLPLLPPPAAEPQDAVAPSLPPDLSDRFSLSTSRVWNLLRLDVDSLLGGLEPADLHGDCRLLCEVRDDVLEKWRDVDECMCMAWERCAGEPCNTNKEEHGESLFADHQLDPSPGLAAVALSIGGWDAGLVGRGYAQGR